MDGEEFVRRIACSILENLGYTCILAWDGVEGVEIFAGEIGRIDLVLLDMVMPRMGGMKCLREIRSRDAAVKILISSGFTQEGLTDLQLEGISGFVKKPFRRIELARAVNRALTGDK